MIYESDDLSKEFARELSKRPLHDPTRLSYALAAEFRGQLPGRLCRSYSNPRSARGLAELQDLALAQIIGQLSLETLKILPDSMDCFCFDWIQVAGVAYPSLGIVYTETALILFEEYAEQRDRLFQAVFERLGIAHIVIVGCEGMEFAKFDGEQWILETLSKVG